MKKIFTSILAPLLSATMFFGCFGGGDKLTSANVKNLYNNYTNSYITTQDNNKFNSVFKNKLNETENKDFVEENGYIVPTYEKIMYISYVEDFGLNAAILNNNPEETESELVYSQLTQIYQRLFSSIFNYYANYNESFYAYVDDEGIESKEVDLLYKKLDNLIKATEELNKEKTSFENSLINISKNISGRIVLDRVPTLYYRYNKVVDASLEFVNYFKDLHKKYIYKINHYDLPVSENLDKTSVDRYVDEAILLLAEAIYYENVKVFEKNVAVENLHFLNMGYKNNPANWITTEEFENLTFANESGLIYANNIMKSEIANNLKSEESYDVIKDLFTHVASFEQNLQNYKTIYKDANLNNYNQLRDFGKRDGFMLGNLSIKEQSNLMFMKDFAETKIPTLFNALFGVVNKY